MYIARCETENEIRISVKEKLEDAKKKLDRWEMDMKGNDKLELIKIDGEELFDNLHDIYKSGNSEFDFKISKDTIRRYYKDNKYIIEVGR